MIGIVAAMRQEVSYFLVDLAFEPIPGPDGVNLFASRNVPGVVLAQGGMGRENAELTTRLVIDEFDPDVIVSAGFAGGASPGAKSGDIFICRRVMALTGPSENWAGEEPMSRTLIDDDVMLRFDSAAAIGGRWGTCISVDEIVADPGQKRWLGQAHGADVIDLESYWVCNVAAARNVASMVVRCVMDPMVQGLPDFISKLPGRRSAGSGRGSFASAALAALRHPWAYLTVLRLVWQMQSARRNLARALSAIAATNEGMPSHRPDPI